MEERSARMQFQKDKAEIRAGGRRARATRSPFSLKRCVLGLRHQSPPLVLFPVINKLTSVDCTPAVRQETRDWLHRQQLAAAAPRPQAVASLLRTRPAADRPEPSVAADDCTHLR